MFHRTLVLPLAAGLCVAAMLLAGCTSPAGAPVPTPTPTPIPAAATTPAPAAVPAGSSSFDQGDNGGTYTVSLGTVFRLALPENPTTGYTWNLSVSPGLSVLNASYVPSDTTGKLVGSGGTRIWFLNATLPGTQTVSGTYGRPWEPAGNGTGFRMTLDVLESSCNENVCTLPTAPVEVHPNIPVYTEADNGRSVEVPVGGTFTIQLQENPTTGYSWNLSLPVGITLSRDEYTPSATGEGIVGAGGVRSFTLAADEPGGWNVTAEYRRPWVPAGTVTLVNSGGVSYGIIGDDGKNYEPLNLDPEYQKDGLRVAYEATPAAQGAGAGTWGAPVNLSAIEEIQGFSLRVTAG